MHEIFTQVIFYLFAGLVILSAVLVIAQNNPVRSVLFLVLCFFGAAVLWLMVDAEFLALILVLVYVGAVMTLFLFVVMMLNIDIETRNTHKMRYLPFGLILVALLTGLLLVALPEGSFITKVEKQTATKVEFTAGVEKNKLSNTEQIGVRIYTDYVYAFELAAVLLLVAIISAITLAHRELIRSKRQNNIKQMMTRSRDRVELIPMKSEK